MGPWRAPTRCGSSGGRGLNTPAAAHCALARMFPAAIVGRIDGREPVSNDKLHYSNLGSATIRQPPKNMPENIGLSATFEYGQVR